MKVIGNVAKKHGRGKKTYADKRVCEGDWKDDRFHGKGRALRENSRESRRTHSLLFDRESERQKCVDFLVNLFAKGQSGATEDRQLSHAKLEQYFEQQRKEISRLTRRIESLEATNKEHLDLLTKREDHIVKCMEKTIVPQNGPASKREYRC